MIEQSGANSAAQDAANQQLALQQQLINMQLQGYNNYDSHLKTMVQEGAFNPDAQIKLADQSRNYQEKQALGNQASAAKILGYRPGDTMPLQTMNQTSNEYNLAAAQQNQQIRNQANANYLAALAPLLPNATGASINALGENYRTDLSQQVGVGGMLGALLPFINPGLNKLGASTGNTSSLYSLGAALGAGAGNLAPSVQMNQMAQLPVAPSTPPPSTSQAIPNMTLPSAPKKAVFGDVANAKALPQLY